MLRYFMTLVLLTCNNDACQESGQSAEIDDVGAITSLRGSYHCSYMYDEWSPSLRGSITAATCMMNGLTISYCLIIIIINDVRCSSDYIYIIIIILWIVVVDGLVSLFYNSINTGYFTTRVVVSNSVPFCVSCR